MNYLEAQNQADCRTDPVSVEIFLIISPLISREYETEDGELRDDISEEYRECLVEFSPEHNPRYAQLQHRLDHPERVIDELNFGVHRGHRLGREMGGAQQTTVASLSDLGNF